MRISQREKEIVEELRNLSGGNIKSVENVLRSLMAYSVLQYANNELITIPRFGSFKISYKGDSITPKGRDAELETLYIPSQEVKTNIGVYGDIMTKGGDISELPIIQEMISSSKKQLSYEIV